MSERILSANSFLENCDYLSQDNDTVYIDEDALISCLERYGDYCATVAINQQQDDCDNTFMEDDCHDNEVVDD